MKILVIDGQGGKMGAALTDQIKKNMPDTEVVAVGTNSLATSAMLLRRCRTLPPRAKTPLW